MQGVLAATALDPLLAYFGQQTLPLNPTSNLSS